MNFQFYVEKLKASEKYKEFVEKNPDAFCCSGFLVRDMGGKDNQQHFDYYLPKEKKVFSFKLENDELVSLDIIDDKVPEKIDLNLDFDLGEVEKMINDKMSEEGIKNKVQKYLFSLQKIDAKHMLIGTVFISMLGMLKVNIDLEKKEIVVFEKKSMFDVLRVKKVD